MRFRLLALACMCSAVLWSCAVEEDAPANQDDKMFLEAWLQTHHPDALRHGMGIYIINDLDTPEDGGTAVEKPCYARVTYTIRDLDGTVTTTSDIDIAKQLGEYEEANYYGPRVWAVRDGAVSKGIEDMLLGMVEGCSREAVIPGWLQTYNRYGTEEEYMAKVTGNSPLIYNVKVNEVTEDIMQWQLDTMKAYSLKYLGGAEPEYEGFYYHVDAAGTGEAEDLHKDTTIFINYTGMLLNGQVFDTTDERIAKDNHIWSAGKTYAPVEVQMSDDSTQVKLDGNEVISGFSSTLWRMKAMETGTGMFYSTMGYGTSGSGSVIPEYAPLLFKIQLVEDPDAEEEDEEEGESGDGQENETEE